MGNKSASEDLADYRNGYPGKPDRLNANDNFLFYNGDIKSVPDGDYIDNFHTNWKGSYAKLEVHHGYIQWLFPIREHGMNDESQPLQLHEIEKMKADPAIIERFLKSYDLILHFYGLVVEDKTTGKLARGDNWKSQLHNLNTHGHNFLRITRILKCLGELGFEHYKRPFMEMMIDEIWVQKTLPACARSAKDYWVGTIKDDTDRKELEDIILEHCGERREVADSSESEDGPAGDL